MRTFVYFCVYLQHISVVNIFLYKNIWNRSCREEWNSHFVPCTSLHQFWSLQGNWRLAVYFCLFLSLYLCTTNIKQLKCAECKTRTGVSKQLAPYFQSFVICLYFSICAISAPSINNSYLRQVLDKQRHYCVLQISRKMYDNVMTFLRHVTCRVKKKWSSPCTSHGHSHLLIYIGGHVTSIDTDVSANIKLLFVCTVN